MTKRLTNLVPSLALLSAYSVAQKTGETTGTVYGVVTADGEGGRVVIPEIKVILNGPTHLEAVSNVTDRIASCLPTANSCRRATDRANNKFAVEGLLIYLAVWPRPSAARSALHE